MPDSGLDIGRLRYKGVMLVAIRQEIHRFQNSRRALIRCRRTRRQSEAHFLQHAFRKKLMIRVLHDQENHLLTLTPAEGSAAVMHDALASPFQAAQTVQKSGLARAIGPNQRRDPSDRNVQLIHRQHRLAGIMAPFKKSASIIKMKILKRQAVLFRQDRRQRNSPGRNQPHDPQKIGRVHV